MMSPRRLGTCAFLTNLGMLFFNAGFTKSAEITALDPNCFSAFGQALILVWGLAFFLAGMGKGAASSPIWFAFGVEKAAYVINYLMWHRSNSVNSAWIAAHKKLLITDDLTELLSPVFILIYGPVDFCFFVLFVNQAVSARSAGEAKKAS